MCHMSNMYPFLDAQANVEIPIEDCLIGLIANLQIKTIITSTAQTKRVGKLRSSKPAKLVDAFILISKNFGRLHFQTNTGSESYTVQNFYRPKYLPSKNVITNILYRNFAKHFSRWCYLLNKSVLECFKVIG